MGKLYSLHVRTDFGTSSFWIKPMENGKFYVQMDSCETTLERSDVKTLKELLERSLKENN